MCGINGIYAYNHSANSPDSGELIATRDHMQARGPDGFGEWWSEGRRMGLGHRRLAVIDTSDRARQPMVSDCGRYVIVFNGEIYNFPALRCELEAQGAVFRTRSDTEVLLKLYARKRDKMVHDLRGMFAFAIWDAADQGLFLARDPSGIKPLYTSDDGWTFRFASQVKALLAGGHVSRDPEPAGAVGFLLLGSVPEPFTLYRDIRQLPAGHTQYVDESGPHEPRPYISIAQVLVEGEQSLLPREETQAHVSTALLDSVGAHLVADVEVGLFLSRGIDSATLLGLMRDAGHTNTTAITLSFSEFAGTEQNEAPGARTLAQLYDAQHVERVVGQAEFEADRSAIVEAMDQPTIDGINMWFVAKAAREAGLKVALCGVGGDELFAGYPSFSDIPFAVRSLAAPSRMPGLGFAWRRMLELTKFASNQPKFRGLFDYGGSYPGAYLLRRGLFLPFELSTILDHDAVQAGLSRLRILDLLQSTITPRPSLPVARVLALESANYMRNQLLRDADWAGMAHGVEIRTPFVDIELLRNISRVIPHVHYKDKKSLLANSVSQPLPSFVVKPKKQGFSVPAQYLMSASSENDKNALKPWSRDWALTVSAHFEASEGRYRSDERDGTETRDPFSDAVTL
jgi:asparagine synthase (glutamine-hydrolysing)